MDDLVGRFQESCGTETSTGFSPRADVAETDHGFEISVDLPGMKAEDVELEIEDGVLTVSGTRESEAEQEGRTYRRAERRHGPFRRSFSLGDEVDSNKVEAEYRDGVLRITVPKAERVRPKKINIKS
jgi:HSP20 family protein